MPPIYRYETIWKKKQEKYFQKTRNLKQTFKVNIVLRSTDTAELGKSNSTRMSPGLHDTTREVEVHKRVTNKKGNEQKII